MSESDTRALAAGGESPPSNRWATVLKAIAALAAVGALIWLGSRLGGQIPAFKEWVEGLGAWGPLAFILGYAAATVAFLPGSILTAAAGIVFGLAKGTLYAFLGATLGASLAFLIARYLARGWVETKIEGKAKFEAVDRAVGRQGGQVVALLRLSPLIPFNVLNYALGLTKVRFLPYLVASLAMLPGTLLYVYYGKVAGDLATVAGGERQKTVWDWVLLGAGLVATLVASVLIAKKARKALDERVDEDLDDLEAETDA